MVNEFYPAQVQGSWLFFMQLTSIGARMSDMSDVYDEYNHLDQTIRLRFATLRWPTFAGTGSTHLN